MKQAQLKLCHAGMSNDTSDQLGLPQQHDLLCEVLGLLQARIYFPVAC